MSKGEVRSAGRAVSLEAARRAWKKERIPSSARFGLLLIPSEALQTVAGKIGTYYGEACFSPLLGFVIKGEANLFDEGGKVRVRMAQLP